MDDGRSGAKKVFCHRRQTSGPPDRIIVMQRLACAIFLTSSLAFAQAPEPVAFEVAAIRPNHSGRTDQHSDSDNDRITCVNMTLKRYISKAYGVREDQISGPDWLGSERFDLVAKAPGQMHEADLMKMLQTLLADRFKLALHRENREGRVYALTVAKGGAKLKAVESTGNSGTSTSRGAMTVKQASMEHVAAALSRHVGFPVVDETGLAGVFDFKLTWDPSADALSPDDARDAGPSIFTALQQQIGLKLESRKRPVETLMIDHAERVPTEN
jgi:uncharacterized protein (TIGR03435 family)